MDTVSTAVTFFSVFKISFSVFEGLGQIFVDTQICFGSLFHLRKGKHLHLHRPCFSILNDKQMINWRLQHWPFLPGSFCQNCCARAGNKGGR